MLELWLCFCSTVICLLLLLVALKHGSTSHIKIIVFFFFFFFSSDIIKPHTFPLHAAFFIFLSGWKDFHHPSTIFYATDKKHFPLSLCASAETTSSHHLCAQQLRLVWPWKSPSLADAPKHICKLLQQVRVVFFHNYNHNHRCVWRQDGETFWL